MARYRHYVSQRDKGDLRRAYFLYGPERMLVEEAVDELRRRVWPPESDSVTLTAGSVQPKEIWAAINQMPSGDYHRLVVVRSAEKIKNWGPFLSWMDDASQRRAKPTVVVFVTEVEPYREKRDDKYVTRYERLPADVMEKFQAYGRVYQMGPIKEDEAVLVLQQRGSISTPVAAQLLRRVGGDLKKAADAVEKAVLFDTEITERLVFSLSSPSPAQEFVTSLIAMDKASAFAAIPQMPSEEYSSTIGTLDVWMERLATLYPYMKAGKSKTQIQKDSGLDWIWVLRLIDQVKFYDEGRIRGCQSALAVVDDRVQQGVYDGVLETLVAVW